MPRMIIEGHAPVEADEGVTVLEACEDHGIPLESACGGFAACNSCRVQVIAGAEHLSDRGFDEEPFLDADDQRLGCQARIRGPVHLRRAPGM